MLYMPATVRYVFIGYCIFVMAVCVVLASNPAWFLRLLAFGRPLPKLMEKRWVQTAYRVVAIGIFFEVLRLLIQALRPLQD
jgi:hypothetical protein